MATKDAPQDDAHQQQAEGDRRQGAPSYDTSKEWYAGISEGALDDPDDVRAARDFAEMIVDTVREGLLVLDLDFRVKAANESFYRAFAVRPEETVGRLVYDLGDGQWDIPELRTLLERILPHDKSFDDYEVAHAFEGVGTRVMLLNARRLDDHHLILLAIEDVTERRINERALSQSEAAFRELADAVPQLVWTAGPDGAVSYYSRQAARYDGLRRRGDGSWAWAPVLHPDDVKRTAEAWRRAVEAGEPYEVEHRLRMADGTCRWHVSRALPTRGAGGHVERWYGTATDVHDMKAAEEALREREAEARRLAAVIARTASGVVVTDTKGRVVWANEAFTRLSGYDLDEVRGRRPAGMLRGQGSDPETAALVEEHVAAREPFVFELLNYRKDGDPYWTRVEATPLHADDGAFEGYVAVQTDVTERRRAEEALRRMNETLEERVGERTREVHGLVRALTLAEQQERQRIAHVLHDDLQQVLYGAKLVARMGTDPDRVLALLDEATTLARALSHELSPPLLESEDLRDVLSWLAEQKRTRYGLEVEVEAGTVLVPEVDLRILLFQLVRELLFNVVKHAGTRRARVRAERSDEHVRISVVDEGAGFDATAIAGAGGLGVPSVRKRLELVGGRLEVASRPGRGTRVTMVVPLRSE